MSPELTPALQPLAFLLGDWRTGRGWGTFVAASGAIYGVELIRGTSFDIAIVDDDEDGEGTPDGTLHWFLIQGGRKQFETTARVEGQTVVLGTGVKVTPRVSAPHQPAPELEAADLAFAAATKTRGADGWAEAFAPDGWMWRKAGATERAAIHDAIAPLLAKGTLAWAPIASGAEGDLGYTVGKATFTPTGDGEGWKSTYITVWKRQPDGTWKVLFDTGRGVNEP